MTPASRAHDPSPRPFVGATARETATHYVSLADASYAGGLQMPRHGHEPAYVTAVLAGGYDEAVGRALRPRPPGSVIFHPADEEHAVRFGGPPTRIFRVVARAPLLARADQVDLDLSVHRPELGAEARWIVARLHREFLRNDPLAPLAIDGLALELAAEIGRRRGGEPPDAGPRGLARARDWLLAHPAERATLSELAALAGIHPVTLAKAFRRRFGCTVGDYLRRLRVERAAHLLSAGDQPIAGIAQETGFADQGHLNRLFRRMTGLTPLQYRRMHRPR